MKVQKGKMPGGGELTSHLQATVLALPCCIASTLQLCLDIFCTCCEVQKQVFLGLYSTCCETSCNELGQTGVKAPQGCHVPNTHLHFRRKNHFYIPNYVRSGLLFSLFFQINCRIFVKLPHESDRDQRIRPPAVLFAPLSTVSPILSSSSSSSSSSSLTSSS